MKQKKKRKAGSYILPTMIPMQVVKHKQFPSKQQQQQEKLKRWGLWVGGSISFQLQYDPFFELVSIVNIKLCDCCGFFKRCNESRSDTADIQVI